MRHDYSRIGSFRWGMDGDRKSLKVHCPARPVCALLRPRRLLDALLKTDPGIEHGIELHIPGEAGDFDDLVIDWREERLQVKWATKAYHSLGHFLHERTFAELARGTQDDPEKLLVRARAIHAERDRVLASTGWNLRLSTRFAMDCDCGSRAEFAMSPKQLKSRARCSACGADYEVVNLAADPRGIQARRWSGR